VSNNGHNVNVFLPSIPHTHIHQGEKEQKMDAHGEGLDSVVESLALRKEKIYEM